MRSPDEGHDDVDEFEVLEVDLHGKRPEEALRHLARELHTARHRRLERVLVITGQGFGNALHKPILRGKVEEWLLAPEGQRRHHLAGRVLQHLLASTDEAMHRLGAHMALLGDGRRRHRGHPLAHWRTADTSSNFCRCHRR